MRLSIFNYGLDPNASVPKHAKAEDDKLVAMAEEIIEKHSFGRGAVIISEAFHTGLMNFNKRKYMEQNMDKSIMSFYSPHVTPFLMHHEMGDGGMFGGGNPSLISVGSNLLSAYTKKKTETATGIASGYGKIATFVPEESMVGTQKAIDALRSRRLLSLSIGAKVNDNDYRCSICGKSRYDEECSHTLGEVYEGEICCVEVYNPLFREYSAVYNPSDINAIVRRVEVNEGEGSTADNRQEVDQNPNIGYINIYDSIGKKIFPSTQPREGGKDMKDNIPKDAAPDSISSLILKYENVIHEKDAIIADREKTISALVQALSERLEKELGSKEPEVETLPEAPPEVPAAEVATPGVIDTEKPAESAVIPPEPTVDTTKEAGNGAMSSPDNSPPKGETKTDVAPGSTTVTEVAPAEPVPPEAVAPKSGEDTGSADTTEPTSKESVRDILTKGRFSQLRSASKSGVQRDPILVAKATK